MDKSKFYKGFKYAREDFTPALKIWHNGLAIKADTWKTCSNFCTYCYARATSYGMQVAMRIMPDLKLGRGMNVKKVLDIFEDAYNYKNRNPYLEWCIRTKRYIELGTIGETFQEADKKYRITWNFLEICDKYKMPLYINTKGNLLCESEEYFNKLARYSAPIIICLTITTVNDEIGKKIEPNAPLPSQRLELIRRLKAVGIPTVVYTAPFLKEITDAPLEEYINKIIEAGAVGLHLRTFYIVAKTQQNPYWRKYYIKNKEYFKGCEWKKDYLIEVVDQMKKIVGNRKFYIVGVKKRWFDSEPYHGKIAFDYLEEKFRKPVVDFTLLPILRKIRQNKNKPQLLTWNNIGYKPDKIDYPKLVKSQEEGGFAHICTNCTCGKNFIKLYKIDGWKWVKGGLWSGWNLNSGPSGDISKIKGIYPVVNKGKFVLEDKKDPQSFVYAYIPQEQKDKYVVNGYVELNKTKSFLVPKREGGTEDKFYEINELNRL